MDNYTGFLRLSLEQSQTGTRIKEAYASGAYKISKLLDADETGQRLVYVMNPGGGYVDGDRYRTEISLEAGAELAVTTQSATKIYKTPHSEVRSFTEVSLARGALLEMLPDPVIAYENAAYSQRTVLRLQPGAAVLCTDAWTPGWSPSGIPFTYRRIDAMTELYVGGELQMVDRLVLEPSSKVTGMGEFEGYTHYGSFLAVHDRGTEEETDRLYEFLQRQFPSTPLRWGITNLQVPGFIMRILANSTEELQHLIGVCHDYVRETWFHKPPLRIRKY